MQLLSVLFSQEDGYYTLTGTGMVAVIVLIAVLVIMALFFLGLMLLPPLGQPSEHSCAVNCFGNLMQDWSILRWGLSDDNGDEAWTPPPDCT